MISEPARRADSHHEQVAALFDQYRNPLSGYLLRLVGERELAHDLTQELFVRVLRRGTVGDIREPRPWLYRLATNLALDQLRRRRLLQWLPLQRAERLAGALPHPEFSDEVTRALNALRPEARAALLLYGAYGFSIGEVAAIFNCRDGAMRTRLFRAREQFRVVYAREAGDGY